MDSMTPSNSRLFELSWMPRGGGLAYMIGHSREYGTLLTVGVVP